MTNDGVSRDMIALPQVIDLVAADELLAAMRQSTSPRLDASAVTTLTLAGMQVILAGILGGGAAKIANPSEAFRAAFEQHAIDWSVLADALYIEVANEDVENAAAKATRILTIDDSKTMRDMLMLTLADAGYHVLQAVDGQDGLDVAGREEIDLVITDINMPRMDGYEVIRHLRRDPKYLQTPILVLTTESEADKRSIARAAGATGWMVKPFDPDGLVATVRKVAV